MSLLFLLPGCGADGGARGDGGMDAGSGSGADATVDASGPRTDSGPSCTPPATPTPIVGCNPSGGIECDGDWAGRCTPACAATECCSPQSNRFTCVPRAADGTCPAADLWVDDSRLSPYYEYRYFAPDDCAVVEGCVGQPGVRRLLRFDTWTPNTGGADMFLGVPSASSTNFQYSACHMHYHFDTYAQYELLTPDRACVAAVGHKQAFCLLDFYDYPCDPTGTDPMVPDCAGIAGGYTCSNQGIRRDAQDVYDGYLDCQWVDVTDVAGGDYVLRIRINTEHLLDEENYDNNQIEAPITVPAPPPLDADVTAACAGATTGPDRDCGLAMEGTHTCAAGTTVRVGCSSRCGLGSCTGDTVLRVCDAAVGTSCTVRHALSFNDDSGCGAGMCAGGDCCSMVQFVCPDSGSYSVFTGSYRTADASTCTVATSP